jgi:hypothetical protein
MYCIKHVAAPAAGYLTEPGVLRHVNAMWLPNTRDGVQQMHGCEIVAGMVGSQIMELHHEASQGFEQILAH